MNEVEKYKKRLQKAQQKVRILEDMIELRSRELYVANQKLKKQNEELDQNLNERTHQLHLTNIDLKRQNKQLEQFAYIASHDLQEPLRTVSNFTGIFKNRYINQLDADAQRFIGFIESASERMQNLVEGLLRHSLIGKVDKKEQVDCKKLIEDIISNFQFLIEETNTNIRIHGNLPCINGFESDLFVLFQNLISNAIKFRKKNQSPIIDISAIQKDEAYIFSVKDNGIGIPEEFYEKIFLIFQRLHNKKTYQGTGIGLAHCKKICDLHGGDIWVIPNTPEDGSTFHIQLPI